MRTIRGNYHYQWLKTRLFHSAGKLHRLSDKGEPRIAQYEQEPKYDSQMESGWARIPNTL